MTDTKLSADSQIEALCSAAIAPDQEDPAGPLEVAITLLSHCSDPAMAWDQLCGVAREIPSVGIPVLVRSLDDVLKHAEDSDRGARLVSLMDAAYCADPHLASTVAVAVHDHMDQVDEYDHHWLSNRFDGFTKHFGFEHVGASRHVHGVGLS